MTHTIEPGAAAAVTAPNILPAIATFDQVRFTWPGARGFTLAIDGLEIARGEHLLIVGPSGGGKSTFLGLLCGTLQPAAGSIRVLGEDLGALPSGRRDRFRADNIGIVFQMFNLLPYGSVIDNVVLPLSFSPRRRARVGSANAARDEARRLLGRLGLDAEELGDERASSLSVGQQQRVAAARALIGAPELIVADEPTSALDRHHQQAFLELVFAEAAAARSTLVMVSHDSTLGPLFSRVLTLESFARTSREGSR